MADERHDPAQVSEETLRSFESDLPGADPAALEAQDRRARPTLQRQGALLLAGMAGLIGLGVAAVVSWLL